MILSTTRMGRCLVAGSTLLFSFLLTGTAADSATAAVESSSTDAAVSWTIYHSWNPQQNFVQRGTISWIPETSLEEKVKTSDDDESILKIDNKNQSLSASDVADMLSYGWYHVKLVPNSNPQDFLLSTVPACHLRRANFKDIFELTLPRISSQKDHVVSMAYTPLVSSLAPKNCQDYPPLEANETKTFQSKTSVKLDTPGMSLKPILSASKPPPGLSFKKRPSKSEKDGRGKNGKTAYDENDDDDGGAQGTEGKPEPPPAGPFGFLQKYWYILVPMLVMQFLSPAPPENPQPQQQQPIEGTTAAPQQNTAAPAPAVATSGGGNKNSGGRRGKRT